MANPTGINQYSGGRGKGKGRRKGSTKRLSTSLGAAKRKRGFARARRVHTKFMRSQGF
jgi:hypothetical protein